MLETHDFLVPDYYPDFHCKIGCCRHSCCENWPISISMADYFRLLGMDCSRELRQRLDRSLHLCEHPTKSRYAQICPGYDGDCALRLKDGRCCLHAEMGEESLSLVCRLYPRGIRIEGGYECSCANSCEAVLEMFLHRREPLRFIRHPMSCAMPECGQRVHIIETNNQEWPIRFYFIRIIQDRTRGFPSRLMSLGQAMHDMSAILEAGDWDKLKQFLEQPPMPQAAREGEVQNEHLVHGLEMAEKMLAQIDQHCQRICEAGYEILECFQQAADPIQVYRQACDKLEEVLPDWRFFLEHALVNHLFFEQFPFQDRPFGLDEEFIGLCGVYSLLRFLAIGWVAAGHANETEMVDLLAAAFRVIEHTSFDYYAANLLQKLEIKGQGLQELLQL